jgi:predicted phosphodiesterase
MTVNNADNSLWAIISDIHANLEALQAVLADIKMLGVRQIVCAGDIVGYAADPGNCLDLIRSLDIPVVQGNHDYLISNDAPLDNISPAARDAVLWTRDQLSVDQKKWLAKLPLVVKNHGFSVVHSSFSAPEDWRYVYNESHAARSFAKQKSSLAFYGHTHRPMGFEKVETNLASYDLIDGLICKPAGQYFINVGSVGQPRDSDPRASYVMLDLNSKSIELRRVHYDIATVAKKIKAASLPARNAARLFEGR